MGDKPGWVTCPTGQLVWGLRRSHCNHALDWHGSLDTEGWSKCDPNYYVAGFYRSCDSLYCLQMAKCCSYKDARWAQCKEVNWFAPFNGPGWVKVQEHQFLAGLYRGAGHKLSDIDKAWSCGVVQGY